MIVVSPIITRYASKVKVVECSPLEETNFFCSFTAGNEIFPLKKQGILYLIINFTISDLVVTARDKSSEYNHIPF